MLSCSDSIHHRTAAPQHRAGAAQRRQAAAEVGISRPRHLRTSLLDEATDVGCGGGGVHRRGDADADLGAVDRSSFYQLLLPSWLVVVVVRPADMVPPSSKLSLPPSLRLTVHHPNFASSPALSNMARTKARSRSASSAPALLGSSSPSWMAAAKILSSSS
eukprot:scaffold21940_cov69-Phaeocystis_antarctica.AAC.3